MKSTKKCILIHKMKKYKKKGKHKCVSYLIGNYN